MSTRHNPETSGSFWGTRSTSYAKDLAAKKREAEQDRKRRAREQKLEAARERARDKEALREAARQERDKVREANRVKREMRKEEEREDRERRKAEAAEREQSKMPSRSAIERAYARGASTLSEAIDMARKNPAKFDRCVKAVKKKGGAVSPYAVCSPLRNNTASYRGKSVAALEQMRVYAEARAYDDDWLVRDRGRRDVEAIDKSLANARKREAKKGNAALPYPGALKLASPDATPKAIAAAKRGLRSGQFGSLPRRKNPADKAAEAFREFTGRDSTETIKVTKQIHFHRHLFEVGKLRKLVIETVDGRYRITLSKLGGAILAANEAAILDSLQNGRKLTQLFVEGGDQKVDLRQFGIDPKNAHELETLGRATLIDYHQVKDHLGDEGGDATYRHKFRQTRIGDRHVTLRVAKYPDVIYRVLDEQLEFSGGSYEIRAEGIDL